MILMNQLAKTVQLAIFPHFKKQHWQEFEVRKLLVIHWEAEIRNLGIVVFTQLLPDYVVHDIKCDELNPLLQNTPEPAH